MEHELDYQSPNFYNELIVLLKSAALIKVLNWGRAKEQTSLQALVKQHNYQVEAYTILNYAKLRPHAPGTLLPAPRLMSSEAEMVWRASEDYVVLALAHLEQPRGRVVDEAHATKERYRVAFLFPNLPENSRRDLHQVRCRFLEVHKTRQRQKDDLTAGPGPGFEYQEADALQCQKAAEDALMGFSKIQQEILREKFLVQLAP